MNFIRWLNRENLSFMPNLVIYQGVEIGKEFKITAQYLQNYAS